VYSLGAILYHLLTGRPPFVGDSVAAILEHVRHNEPVAPRALNPAAPRDLETICLKCLEKAPSRRYASARELTDELARFQRDEPIRARPAGLVEKLWRSCRRRPALAGSLGAAAVFLVAGLAATFWQWRRAERHSGELSTTVTRLKLDQAEQRLAGGETSEALALLADLLRPEAANPVAAQRVVSVLSQRNFLRPLPGSAETWHVRWTCGLAQHSNLVVTTGSDGRTLSVWDASRGFDLKRTIPVDESVRLSAFSRDGRYLAVATQEKSLRLYNLTDGSLRSGPYPLDGLAMQLFLDADAAHAVVVTSPDDSAASWRNHRGRVIRLTDGIRLHQGIEFHHAAFSPDGRRVLTINYGAVQVREAPTWAPLGKPLTDASRINAGEWSPDSRLVVTAGAAMNATVWRADSGEAVQRLIHDVNVQAAFFSPDGARIFSQDNANQGQFWDLATGQRLGAPFSQEKGFSPASFSPDGRRFLSYSRNATRLHDVETGLPLAESLIATEVPTRARFLPDGRRFVAATMDGSTRLWEAVPSCFAPKVFLERLELSGGSLSPDGALVALVVKANSFRILDAAKGEPVVAELLHALQEIRSVRWSLDSRCVVTASINGTARIWNARAGQAVGDPIPHAGPLSYAEFSPNGRWLATASEDGTARIWNATNGRPASPPLKHDRVVQRARFNPDGTLLVSASLDRTVRFWSVPEGREVGAALTNELDFSDAVFSPDGQRVGTMGKAAYAQIWDVQSRRELTPRLRHAGYVSTIRFSPDSRRVVTGSSDGTARVWDARTGQPISRPLRHREEITVAEFSPDGRFVLTASIDATARLWDAETGHAVSDPFRHEQRIVAGEWARDGRRFLTVSYDRTGRLWPVFLAPDGQAPSWLADLAEATGGLRLTGEEIFQHVPADEALAVHDRMRKHESTGAWSEWVRGLFAEPAGR
jgi:WD40 repeat protein